MTASADYGVSIVESFTPPKQWIPGQKVNKDVYDVNTGNIAAFVNDDISGVLTYTYETTVSTFDATNGVKLNKTALTDIDGATTMEAGAVLAWTDTDEPLGTKVSARENENSAVAGRWTPDSAKPGIYIFRRSIDDSGAQTDFTYSGYYFNGTDYYKIAIGGDVNPTGTAPNNYLYDVSTTSLGAGVTVDKDGIVTSGTPAVKYIIETKVNAENMTYTYDGTGEDKKLVFTYTAPIAGAGDGTYDATADAARKEVEYENAKKYSDLADKLYANAAADLAYAKTLAEESNKLIAAAKAANTAASDLAGKKAAKDNAYDDIFAASTGSLATFKTDFGTFATDFATLDPDTFVPANVKAAANLKTNSTDYDYPYVHQNYTELDQLYTDMEGYKSAIDSAVSTLEGLADPTNKQTDPDAIQAQVNIILNNLYKNAANYQKALNDFKAKYANLVNSATTDASISVDTSDATAKKTAIQTAIGKLTTAKNDADDLNTDAGEYDTAYDEWSTANSSTAVADYATAVDTYNTNVGIAKNTYDSAVTNNGVNQNHGADLVSTYSLTDIVTPGNTNPAISDATAAKANYAGYAALSDKTVEDADSLKVKLTYTDTVYNSTTDAYDSQTNTDVEKKVSEWEAFKNAKETAEQTAKNAYDDAAYKVDNASEIKINVILDKDWATNWTRDDRQDGTEVASFYLNKILEAGETTPKLVDSVELDSGITKGAYKNLTFDLNVALDSAQITYADDQVTVTDDAVQAPAFGMKSHVQPDNTTVSWATT